MSEFEIQQRAEAMARKCREDGLTRMPWDELVQAFINLIRADNEKQRQSNN